MNCPTGCTACSSATNCSSCASGYKMNGTICSPFAICQDGTYYDNVTKKCEACMSNCDLCMSILDC